MLGVCGGLYVVILCVVEEIVVKIAGDREEQIILYFFFSDKPNETLLYSYIVYYTISPPYTPSNHLCKYLCNYPRTFQSHPRLFDGASIKTA